MGYSSGGDDQPHLFLLLLIQHLGVPQDIMLLGVDDIGVSFQGSFCFLNKVITALHPTGST